jgi:hypothetical protein
MVGVLLTVEQKAIHRDRQDGQDKDISMRGFRRLALRPDPSPSPSPGRRGGPE